MITENFHSRKTIAQFKLVYFQGFTDTWQSYVGLDILAVEILHESMF